jgi:hypothetical protein
MGGRSRLTCSRRTATSLRLGMRHGQTSQTARLLTHSVWHHGISRSANAVGHIERHLLYSLRRGWSEPCSGGRARTERVLSLWSRHLTRQATGKAFGRGRRGSWSSLTPRLTSTTRRAQWETILCSLLTLQMLILASRPAAGRRANHVGGGLDSARRRSRCADEPGQSWHDLISRLRQASKVRHLKWLFRAHE